VDERDADALSATATGPIATDLEFAARDQRLRRQADSSTRTRRARGSRRWSASSPGCRSCTRWSRAERQLEVPKYVRPRTDTPALTIGHGGCFGCIYSCAARAATRCSGSRRCRSTTRRRGEVFLRPGDIVKFRPIDASATTRCGGAARACGSPDVSFSLDEFEAEPDGYNGRLLEVLG
jgi:urea carboxylase